MYVFRSDTDYEVIYIQKCSISWVKQLVMLLTLRINRVIESIPPWGIPATRMLRGNCSCEINHVWSVADWPVSVAESLAVVVVCCESCWDEVDSWGVSGAPCDRHTDDTGGTAVSDGVRGWSDCPSTQHTHSTTNALSSTHTPPPPPPQTHTTLLSSQLVTHTHSVQVPSSYCLSVCLSVCPSVGC